MDPRAIEGFSWLIARTIYLLAGEHQKGTVCKGGMEAAKAAVKWLASVMQAVSGMALYLLKIMMCSPFIAEGIAAL